MALRDSLTAAGYQFFIGVIIFFLFLVVGNDIVKPWVDVALTNQVIDGITITNVITWFSVISLFTALILVNILTFRIRYPLNERTSKAVRSLLGTLAMVFIFLYFISIIALNQFPNFVITPINFAIIPTLFMIFTIGNPAGYLGVIAILYIFWNFIFNLRLGVELSQ